MCCSRIVPLFSNGNKGCFFCWVQVLLGVYNGAAFLAMCIRNIP